MANKIGVIISLAIGFIMMGILLPLGLNDLTSYDGTYNASYTSGTDISYNAGTSTTMLTLIATILPVMIVISIILVMVATMRKRGAD